jgi:hypothetical protein
MRNNRLTNEEITRLHGIAQELDRLSSLKNARFDMRKDEDEYIKEKITPYMLWFRSCGLKIEEVLQEDARPDESAKINNQGAGKNTLNGNHDKIIVDEEDPVIRAVRKMIIKEYQKECDPIIDAEEYQESQKRKSVNIILITPGCGHCHDEGVE